MTRYIETECPEGINGGEIRRKNTITCLVWLAIFAGVIVGLLLWNNTDVLIGAGIAAVVSLVLSFRGSAPGSSTIADYFSAYGQYISEETRGRIMKGSKE